MDGARDGCGCAAAVLLLAACYSSSLILCAPAGEGCSESADIFRCVAADCCKRAQHVLQADALLLCFLALASSCSS